MVALLLSFQVYASLQELTLALQLSASSAAASDAGTSSLSFVPAPVPRHSPPAANSPTNTPVAATARPRLGERIHALVRCLDITRLLIC
jgi:hypothetical protein